MNTKDSMKVVVGMSGGVDSSVTAALLKERGCQVSGVIMQVWDSKPYPENKSRHGCYRPGEEEDIADARRVADILEIPFYVLDMRQEYRTEVLDYFRDQYLSGRTPNPCLRCNHRVKFGSLLTSIKNSGIDFDYFATGHYARVERDQNSRRYLLKKAGDLTKDQSYFLASLSQEQLACSIFPLGDYAKQEVRQIASDSGLGVADKPESQDFITEGYHSLLETVPPGPIRDKTGKTIGEHRGIPFYTIGQRKGLGITAREPLYVTAIDADSNSITAGYREELYQDHLTASELNWIAIDGLKQPTAFQVKIRSAQKETPATVTPSGEDRIQVKFDQPQMAITPGQTAVFYRGDIVIGSGTIERTSEE